MRNLTRAVAMSAACALSLIATASATADSITYVGSDGNVHLVSPDGSKGRQVTTDGTPSRPYESPSQTDDGTVVAIGFGGEYTKFAQFFDPATGALEDARLLPDGNGVGAFPGLTGGQVSPDGAFYLYDFGDTRTGVRYATSLIGDSEVQDPCAIRCKYSWVSPRYAAGGSSLVIDPYFGDNGVGVQPPGDGDPVPWFNLNGDGSGDGVSSVDESAGVLALEYVAGGSADSILDLEIDKPSTGLVMATYSGAPGSGLPTATCALAGFSSDPAYPRLSPDGSMLAWGGPEGIYVSPVPAAADTCALQPRLIAPGGKRPDWGPADVPGGGGSGSGGGSGTGTDPGTNPGTDPGAPDAEDACAVAKEKVKDAKKALKRAKKRGNAKRVAKAKKKLGKAKRKAKKACA